MKWLLPLFLLMGCAWQPAKVASDGPLATLDVCLDSAFTAEERSDVGDAIFNWGAAFQGVVALVPRVVDAEALDFAGCRVVVLRVTTNTPWVQQASSRDLGYAASTPGRWVWIIADRKPDFRCSVTAHELGHAWGLQHTPLGLMAPSTDGQCIVSSRDAVWAAYMLGTEAGR